MAAASVSVQANPKPDFNLGSALGYITVLEGAIRKTLQDNINTRLGAFVVANREVFSDYKELNKKVFNIGHDGEPTGNFWRLTFRQWLLLATCYNVRFVSAQDRENRKCLTASEGPNSRLDGKLSLQSYEDMKPNRKYIGAEFEELFHFTPPKPGLLDILKTILGTDDLAAECQTEITPLMDWTSICTDVTNRKWQVIVYDLLQIVCYNQAVSAGLIDPLAFNTSFDQFKEVRNGIMNTLIVQSKTQCDILLLQEANVKTYKAGLSGCVVEPTTSTDKDKAKHTSAIWVNGSTVTDLTQLTPEYDAINHDIVVATAKVGPHKLLILSIHTPSDGGASAGILNWCFEQFRASDASHLLVGIDANTKTPETRENFVETLLKNNGRFAYFNASISETLIGQIDEREVTEKTATGKRAFATQSQFGKAGDEVNHYIDFIILAEKPKAPKVTVLETTDFESDMLSNTNPSDHAPRLVRLQIGDVVVTVKSWNVAGPNDKLLEYCSN